jgi:hypothetical protein
MWHMPVGGSRRPAVRTDNIGHVFVGQHFWPCGTAGPPLAVPSACKSLPSSPSPPRIAHEKPRACLPAHPPACLPAHAGLQCVGHLSG